MQAMQRARQEAAGLSQGSGAISGTVVGIGGIPLRGACVTAVGDGRSVTATAAPDGAFTLAGLSPGSYALAYRDCAAPGLYATTWSGGAGWQSTGARIKVQSGQVRHVPGMMLRPIGTAAAQAAHATWRRILTANAATVSAAAAAKTGRISGTVTGRGKRLSGICVVAVNLDTGNDYGATTSKAGYYRIGFLPAGGYGVVFAPTSFCNSGNWPQQVYKGHDGPFPETFNTVTVRADSAATGISAKLLLGGEISGTVKSRSGHPISGICVNLLGNVSGGFAEFGLATGKHGGYDIKALFRGSYTLQFTGGCGNTGNFGPAQHFRPINISHGTLVKGLVTVLPPGATITGTVRLGSASGTLLAGICVLASSANGLVFAEAATGPHGSFRIPNLGNGRYQVDFSPGCNSNGNYTSATRFVKTAEGKVIGGVNAVLQPGATISGTVTNASGQGVANMCVELFTSGNGSANVPEATNPDGTYVINQLAAGTYEVGFDGGCGNTGSYSPYWYDNQDDPSIATPIALATGQATTVNPVLQPGGTVSGTVTNAAGAKLSGICVTIASASDDFYVPANLLEEATTHDGTYSLPDLAPGQYLVDFGCDSSTTYGEQWFPDAADEGAAQQVSVPTGTTTVNAVLQRAGSVTGTVTGPNGRPLAGVCVAAYSTADQTAEFQGQIDEGSGAGITGSNGRYQLLGLAPGSYHVQFVPCLLTTDSPLWYDQRVLAGRANAITVQSGKVTTGINAQLRKSGSFSGRVTNSAGAPVSGACVEAFNATGSIFQFGFTDPTGAYTVSGLASGGYSVEFTPCFSQLSLDTVLGHVTIKAPGTTKGVNATLQAGGSVSGVVTLAGSPTVPVEETCVEVISPDPGNPGGITSTNPDGTYEVTGLAPGTYQVYFGDPNCSGASPDLAPQWFDNAATQATATTITVTAGHTTPAIDAAVQFDGQITGSVTDSSDAGVSGACVVAVPQSPGALPLTAISGSGTYTLVGLAPGDYVVEFAPGCGATGFATQWWQDASSKASATPVSVGPDQTVAGISATVGS
jgi:protocatechuate 3,4-dioxygenase beta subunit